MKSFVSILLALLIGVLLPLPLYAQEQETLLGDKFKLKVGYKVWAAYWSAPRVLSADGSSSSQFESKGVMALSGPAATLTYTIRENDWLNSAFLSFSWLNGGTNFQPIQGFDNTAAPATTTIQTEAALRRDYNITAGLAIWRGIGIHAGYYNKRDQFNGDVVTSTLSGAPVSSFNQDSAHITRTIDGPLIGLFGNTELTERVNMYGNLSYAILNFNTRPKDSGQCFIVFGCSQTSNAYGYSGEFGAHLIGPAIWKITPELQIGYRFQVIQANLSGVAVSNQHVVGPSTVNDLTHGPIFTVSARF